jgi:hypothetical protein
MIAKGVYTENLMKFIFIILTLATSLTASARTLKVMSYNAHNLFDNRHDEGKNDWEYLPKNYPGKNAACMAMEDDRYQKRCLQGDWTQDKLDLKITQLLKVIENQGKPDFLALSEVENKMVVMALAKKLGFNKVITTNSPDHRGIDVALAFNTDSDVEFVIAKEFIVNATKSLKEKPTRNILEVVLKIAGEPVSMFVNHWPSQGNPTVNRIAAAKVLKKAINKRARKSKNHKFVAVGDFNTLEKDYPHPFKSIVLTNYVDSREEPSKNPLANIYSKLSKKPNIVDLHAEFMDNKEIDRDAKKVFPKGTYFYVTDQTWNMLDRIFISKNILSKGKVQVDMASYKIETPTFAVREFEYNDPNSYMFGTIIKGIPFRSNHNAMTASDAGYSDHFPVSFNIKIE